MTEANTSPSVVEHHNETEKTGSATPVRGCSSLATTISVLALIIALGSAAGGYLWLKRQANLQHNDRLQLISQLNSLQTQQRGLKNQLDQLSGQAQHQAGAAAQAANQTSQLLKRLDDVQRKVAMISGADANNWLLAQADFLVTTAGHKLWSDQDTLTAAVLLKSADENLASMQDSSLINARRAIAADLATLAAINQIDYDGIILQLNQLADQVDNLRLADDNTQSSDGGSRSLSASWRDWRENLRVSWHHFLDNFITIRRRDSTAVPLLAPDQAIYLRENLRSRLLIAAQAVPRHQQETYQQALDNVSTWIRAYYNVDDAASKAFLSSLAELGKQTISMDLPETLQSQPILDKLVQSRLRNPPAAATMSGQHSGEPQTGDQRYDTSEPLNTSEQQNTSEPLNTSEQQNSNEQQNTREPQHSEQQQNSEQGDGQ